MLESWSSSRSSNENVEPFAKRAKEPQLRAELTEGLHSVKGGDAKVDEDEIKAQVVLEKSSCGFMEVSKNPSNTIFLGTNLVRTTTDCQSGNLVGVTLCKVERHK